MIAKVKWCSGCDHNGCKQYLQVGDYSRTCTCSCHEATPERRGWFADIDQDQPAGQSHRYRPCLETGTGHIPCFDVWFESEAACDTWIRREVIGVGMLDEPPDPCATKLARIMAALTVEAERLEAEAKVSLDRASDALNAFNEYAAGEACGKAYAQTAQAKRLREIIKEASNG